MSAIGLFHPGKQHSLHTAAALASAGALEWYATSIYFDPSRWPYSLLRGLPGWAGRKIAHSLERRASELVEHSRVRHLPAHEWLEMALAKSGLRRAAVRVNACGNRLFERRVLDLAVREPVARLWGYDTSSRHVFEAARESGAVCILDQSIAHLGGLREQLIEHRQRHGDLISKREIPSERAVNACTAEIAAASHVVVGSDYAAALARRFGAGEGRVHVCPYGYQESNFPDTHVRREGLGELPVRFFFAGTVSARKGFHLLADVFATMPPGHASLTMVGPSLIPPEVMRRHLGNIRYIPAVSNRRLGEIMASAHCFVFPSLHEGGGIVLYEAAASGLGIIQTASCGDGVRSGSKGPNGVVLADNGVDALREAVEAVIARPAILRDWSAASRAMREERSWSAYRRRIVELLPRLV